MESLSKLACRLCIDGKCAERECSIYKTDRYCIVPFLARTEDAEEQIKELYRWGKDNPVKTYKMDFVERFPKAIRESNGCLKSCLANAYGVVELENCDGHCEECWNAPFGIWDK